jgi:hypothetical protein
MQNLKSLVKPLGLVLFTAIFAASNAVASLPESVKTLLNGYEFRNVSVSPSGKYISLIMKEDERGTLVILNRSPKSGWRCRHGGRAEEEGGRWRRRQH